MLTKAWRDDTARLLACLSVWPLLAKAEALSSELSHRRLLNRCVRFATMISGSFIGWSNSNWSSEVTGCTRMLYLEKPKEPERNIPADRCKKDRRKN